MQFYNTRWFWVVTIIVLFTMFFVVIMELDWLIGMY